ARATRGEPHGMTAPRGPAAAGASSPGGARLLSGAWDGTVRVWDFLSGQEVLGFKGDPKRIWSVAFSPGGTLAAAAGDDGRIRLWKGPRNREEVQLRYRNGPSTWDAARTGARP